MHGGLLTEYDYVLDLSHITYMSLDKSPELSRLKLVHFRMGRITLALTHCQGFARSENIYKKVSTYKIVHCKLKMYIIIITKYQSILRDSCDE